MKVALWAQAVALFVFVPVVLLVPEIPLGRVVAADLRWVLAAAGGGLGVISLSMARDPHMRRWGALALGVAAGLGLVGVAIEGGVRGGVVAGLLLVSLAINGSAARETPAS
ncbi:MAG: hypothetical protein EP330_12395 [Deltaproteobacteria bacterium]|nr:MAG: hypothetical protein EP330_12395 [Deltaproteobacteria bacterium]